MLEAPSRLGSGAIREVRLPAAASLAVRDVLMGSCRPWRLLGVSTHAWWCAAADDVIVVTDDRVARLPNAVVTLEGFGAGSRQPIPGAELLIGDGMVRAGSTAWDIVRWWEPRVAPNDAEADDILHRLRGAAASIPASVDDGLGAALRGRDADEVIARAAALLGRGTGLTPESDDFLVGAVAGYRHVALSIGDVAAAGVVEAIHDRLLAAARVSTTRLSCSLLHHAFRGEVPAPVGALLRALTGRGEVAPALADTGAIGGSSGPALVSGVLCGAAAACGVRL